MPEDAVKPTGSAGGSDDSSTPGAGEGGKPPINPELEKRLSDENAKIRLKNKELSGQVAALTSAIEEIKAKVEGNGTPAPKPGDPPKDGDDVALLRQQMKDLHKKLEAATEETTKEKQRAAQRVLRSGILKAASEAKVIDIENAALILEARGARLKDDGESVVIELTDKDGDKFAVPLTGENLKKYGVLPDHFFPAEQVPGSGSAATAGGPAGLDLEKAREFSYYEKNRNKINEALSGQRR